MKKNRLYILYLLLDKDVLYDYDIKWLKPLREVLPNEDDPTIRFTETVYAVSDNTKDVDDFLSFRNKKKFRVEKIDFDSSDELNKAKMGYSNIMIISDDISFKHKVNDFKCLSILTTSSEMEIISEYVDGFQESMYNIVDSDYRGFKEEYIRALDILAYTYFYAVLTNGDDLQDVAENCMSYGMSPEGHVKSNKFGYKFLDFVGFTNGILNYIIK